MPAVLDKPAEKKATAADGGRKFKIITERGQVGPWVPGNVFDEREFKRLTPIPDNAEAKQTIDPETYHADLIDRLLALEVIAHAPDAELTQTPLGPESSPGRPVVNDSIRKAIAEALEEAEKRREMEKLRANTPPLSQMEPTTMQHGGTRRA